jgi:hypothetical protein
MTKRLMAGFIAAAVAFACNLSANAQDSVVFVPVDINGCTFNEGRGPADLDAAVEKFNAYMDGNDNDAYAAWTMTKAYTSPDQEFDFAWLGAHKNGTTMGAGADAWRASGGEVLAEFGKVATCAGWGNYASRMFKAPPGGNVPQDGVMVFSNCKVEEGKTYDDAIAAVNEWVGILTEAGSTAAMYHWYPVYGTGENDINYKAVTAYPNHTELGKDYDRIGNGGLFVKQNELMRGVVDCDVSRVYDAKMRRGAKIRD